MKRKVVAVTGGIGSGKSTVCAFLESKGYNVIYLDKVSREIADCADTIADVQKLLGANAVNAEGKLNRAYIRSVVFADDKLYKSYGDLFYDKVQAELERRLAEAAETVFVEIPLFDAVKYDWYAVWVVRCDKDKRVERVEKRDNVDRQNVADILARQTEPDLPHATVIRNDGTEQQLAQAVSEALAAL